MFGRSIPPYLGGGRIFAARWKHRISTDVDVLVPGPSTLIDLLHRDDRNIVNQLGTAPEGVAGDRVKIAFERGLLDISTFRPDPPTATPSPPSTASSIWSSPATRSCAASSIASTSCSSATSSTS
ncbi:MAG: hypothetical protein OXF27_04870 [Acidobacteria bacterium]|nr:hypothetical protein [Acidobacteriota bacterium]